jgi:hypothetical protein
LVGAQRIVVNRTAASTAVREIEQERQDLLHDTYLLRLRLCRAGEFRRGGTTWSVVHGLASPPSKKKKLPLLLAGRQFEKRRADEPHNLPQCRALALHNLGVS